MKTSILQIANDYDNYSNLYDFIYNSESLNADLHLLINPKGQRKYMSTRNPFASVIEFNSCMESYVLEHINSCYPKKINMKSGFIVAYTATLEIRKQLVFCYTNTTMMNEAINTSIRWLDSLISFCRNEKLYGALAGYLHLYGEMLNILCGEDIY